MNVLASKLVYNAKAMKKNDIIILNYNSKMFSHYNILYHICFKNEL